VPLRFVYAPIRAQSGFRKDVVNDDRPELVALMRALRTSQRRLADSLVAIPVDEVDRPAYTRDWTVAQVASHLGSGAQTFLLFLAAGRDGTAAPGVEQFQPIWDRWNAKPPNEQVHDALEADAAFLDAVDALSGAQQQTWRLQMFGTARDLPGLLRMRLAEHALHTWDIVVVLDRAAVLPADAAGLVVENLPMIVQYVAKPTAPMTVRIETVDPELVVELALAPEGSRLNLTAAVEQGAPELRMPAEAFVRLLYGRLDPDHTPPSVHADPDLLDALRATFPGV
jgi:uncharacterized protein (TIGR03083 family)